MAKFVTVRVTKEHIKTGKPKKATRCPVAKACRAAGFKNVSVSAAWIDFGKRGQGTFVVTPRRAARFINRFDAGKPVKPFSFRVRVADNA